MQPALASHGLDGELDLDASLGRQVAEAIDLLQARLDAGELGSVVIVHVGNNRTFSAKQFDQMMEVLAGAARVVFVNVKVPRQWEEENNTVIAEGERYANAVLVDWHGAVAEQPDLFWKDGTHLRPEGAEFYAELLAEAVATDSAAD